MRVLLLEGPGSERRASAVAEGLAAAGHEVTTCHDEGEPAFPCYGMLDDHRCPLDAAPVTVAVALGSGTNHGEAPPATHDGARCALRRQIPLVVQGPMDASPLAPWATRECTSDDPATVLAAVEEAAAAPLRRQQHAATRALRSVLELHGVPSDGATATVTRSGDRLSVRLSPPAPVDHRLSEVLSVRALAAVRDADPFAGTIDVGVDDDRVIDH